MQVVVKVKASDKNSPAEMLCCAEGLKYWDLDKYMEK
jgi:hypothetical protein